MRARTLFWAWLAVGSGACAGSGPIADAGAPWDAQTDDAAVPDAGLVDAAADAGVPDTGFEAADAAVPDAAVPDGAVPDAGPGAFDAGPAPCAEVDAFQPVFADLVTRWNTQGGDWPADSVVFVGSSSIRRWERLLADYSGYDPLQRGFGGSQLGEVAHFADALILRHNPRAVVIFAGTNDLANGVAPGVVVERFRCLRHRIGAALGWDRPVVFIGITPSPSRWAGWPDARAVNDAVQALAAADPGLFYADVPTPFLATGSPPDPSLFAPDRLHLSPAGYALWTEAIRPALAAATTLNPPFNPQSLAPGTRLLVDLGPSNPEDGEPTPSPDYLGQHWNNWHPLGGGAEVLPGEHLVDLVTTTGAPTSIDLVIAGGFRANGRRSGGLLWPSAASLGNLAVGSATGDFFYADGDDLPGALSVQGLDPNRRYTVRLFAARDDAQRRVTRYVLEGAATVQASLQTSGPGAGAGQTNDDDVAVFSGVAPDAWGHLFIDLQLEAGTFAYLSLLELTVE